MKRDTRGNLTVGRAQTTPSQASHTKGIRQGNAVGNYEAQEGHLPDGTSSAARSTGINAAQRNPILPGMPNLSPP